jgi:hypothetical protein
MRLQHVSIKQAKRQILYQLRWCKVSHTHTYQKCICVLTSVVGAAAVDVLL